MCGLVLASGCGTPSESTCGAGTDTDGCTASGDGSSSSGAGSTMTGAGSADTTMSGATAGSASGASSTDGTTPTASTTESPETTADTTAASSESTAESSGEASTSAATQSSAEGEGSTGEPITCPNDMIDRGEQCDGDDLAGNTCLSLGFAGGALGCAADCSFDASDCAGLATCGNGVVDPGEQCDGGDLGGASCEDAGEQFGGGALGCSDNCGFDTAGCCVDFAASCAVHECCGDLTFCGLLTQLCL